MQDFHAGGAMQIIGHSFAVNICAFLVLEGEGFRQAVVTDDRLREDGSGVT